MQPSTITAEEKARITDQNAHLFKARHIADYWPNAINSQRIMDFIQSQLGMPLDEWPYPIHLDQFEVAFEYLNSQHMLYPRPEEEPEPEDPAVTREREAQQRVRDDYDARQAAEKTAREKAMPLHELGKIVSVQNKDFRNQREQNLLPVRATGLESRHVEQVKLGIPAQARVNVGLAHPELSPKSGEFSKLCAAEVVRLRSQQ